MTKNHTRKIGWGTLLAIAGVLCAMATPALAAQELPESPAGEVSPAKPSEASTPLTPEQLEVTIPVLENPGSPDSAPLSSARPWFIAVDATGATALATDGVGPEIFVFDLAERAHVATLAPSAAGRVGTRVAASVSGNRAIVAYSTTPSTAPDLLLVIDTATRTVEREIEIPRGMSYRVTISPDGNNAYLGNSGGAISRVSLGDPTDTDAVATGWRSANDLVVSPDGSILYLGIGTNPAELAALNTSDLSVHTQPQATPGQWQYHSMTFVPEHPEAIYLSAFDSRIAKLDVNEGLLLQSVPVGQRMSAAIGDPEHNRAWGSSFGYSLVQVADFGAGQRADGFRSAPGGPIDMAQRPNRGELIVTNGGQGSRGPDASITVFLKPAMTDPQPVIEVDAVGDTATFSVETEGIKADNSGSGVVWQSSGDGETWTDLEPVVRGTKLTLTADGETIRQQYRARYVDDFWASEGASTPGRIVGPAPEITDDISIVTGSAGEALGTQQFTAIAQPGYVWSVTGLPEGLTLDPQTGALTGTPTTAGTAQVTVTVTDVFGVDFKTVTIVVKDPDPDPDPDPAPTPGGGGGGAGGTTPPSAKPGGQEKLPGTGMDPRPSVAVATGALLLGTAALLYSRRALRLRSER